MYYIIPIIHKEIETNEKYSLVKCALFLERNGTSCISLNDSNDPIGSAKEFLKMNELFLLDEPILLDKIIYAKIDPIKTDLSSFYNWSEILPSCSPSKEVWRYFIWNVNNPDTWGTNVQLENIDVYPFNMAHILKGYFRLANNSKQSLVHV